METVCHGKQWDVVLIHDNRNRIAAAMPYHIGSRMGLRYILQPQLTQYNGPWYRSDIDPADFEKQLADHFCHTVRPLFFQQNFGPGTPVGKPWNHKNAVERITYRIEDISDPQQVFDNFDKQRRQRPIRRAEKTLSPSSLTPQQFAQFHAEYWASRGQRDLLSHDFMVRVIQTALDRNQGILLGVADQNGKLHAARFVAYDSQCAYSFLSALNPNGHENGASALLFWLIIQQLSGHTRAFDFEGSMDPGIAFSYSLYGAQPITYHRITYYRYPILRPLLKRKIEK